MKPINTSEPPKMLETNKSATGATASRVISSDSRKLAFPSKTSMNHQESSEPLTGGKAKKRKEQDAQPDTYDADSDDDNFEIREMLGAPRKSMKNNDSKYFCNLNNALKHFDEETLSLLHAICFPHPILKGYKEYVSNADVKIEGKYKTRVQKIKVSYLMLLPPKPLQIDFSTPETFAKSTRNIMTYYQHLIAHVYVEKNNILAPKIRNEEPAEEAQAQYNGGQNAEIVLQSILGLELKLTKKNTETYTVKFFDGKEIDAEVLTLGWSVVLLKLAEMPPEPVLPERKRGGALVAEIKQMIIADDWIKQKDDQLTLELSQLLSNVEIFSEHTIARTVLLDSAHDLYVFALNELYKLDKSIWMLILPFLVIPCGKSACEMFFKTLKYVSPSTFDKLVQSISTKHVIPLAPARAAIAFKDQSNTQNEFMQIYGSFAFCSKFVDVIKLKQEWVDLFKNMLRDSKNSMDTILTRILNLYTLLLQKRSIVSTIKENISVQNVIPETHAKLFNSAEKMFSHDVLMFIEYLEHIALIENDLVRYQLLHSIQLDKLPEFFKDNSLREIIALPFISSSFFLSVLSSPLNYSSEQQSPSDLVKEIYPANGFHALNRMFVLYDIYHSSVMI